MNKIDDISLKVLNKLLEKTIKRDINKNKKEDNDEILLDEEEIDQVAPPGGEHVIKALKKKKGIKNPYAIAWSMKNKGYI